MQSLRFRYFESGRPETGRVGILQDVLKIVQGPEAAGHVESGPDHATDLRE